MLKKLVLTVLFILPIIGLYSDEFDNKVLVLKENVILTDEGIFLINDGEIEPVEAVYFGHQGLYIKAMKDVQAGKKEQQATNKCPNGHDIYDWACGGCANWWCVFRCKCHSPWTNKQ